MAKELTYRTLKGKSLLFREVDTNFNRLMHYSGTWQNPDDLKYSVTGLQLDLADAQPNKLPVQANAQADNATWWFDENGGGVTWSTAGGGASYGTGYARVNGNTVDARMSIGMQGDRFQLTPGTWTFLCWVFGGGNTRLEARGATDSVAVPTVTTTGSDVPGFGWQLAKVVFVVTSGTEWFEFSVHSDAAFGTLDCSPCSLLAGDHSAATDTTPVYGTITIVDNMANATATETAGALQITADGDIFPNESIRFQADGNDIASLYGWQVDDLAGASTGYTDLQGNAWTKTSGTIQAVGVSGYTSNEVVSHNGLLYVALQGHTNITEEPSIGIEAALPSEQWEYIGNARLGWGAAGVATLPAPFTDIPAITYVDLDLFDTISLDGPGITFSAGGAFQVDPKWGGVWEFQLVLSMEHNNLNSGRTVWVQLSLADNTPIGQVPFGIARNADDTFAHVEAWFNIPEDTSTGIDLKWRIGGGDAVSAVSFNALQERMRLIA